LFEEAEGLFAVGERFGVVAEFGEVPPDTVELVGDGTAMAGCAKQAERLPGVFEGRARVALPPAQEGDIAVGVALADEVVDVGVQRQRALGASVGLAVPPQFDGGDGKPTLGVRPWTRRVEAVGRVHGAPPGIREVLPISPAGE
jgi:hypothetical protein